MLDKKEFGKIRKEIADFGLIIFFERFIYNLFNGLIKRWQPHLGKL